MLGNLNLCLEICVYAWNFVGFTICQYLANIFLKEKLDLTFLHGIAVLPKKFKELSGSLI